MMTLEYLHPQQAETMYLHHPTASGGYQQQTAHPPPAPPPPHHPHQFSTADYWQQLHGVTAGGDQAVSGASPAVSINATTHHQPNSPAGWTAGGIAGAIAASAGGAPPVTEWQYLHHASPNPNSVSCAPSSVYTGVSDDYVSAPGQGQAYVSGPGGIQTVAQALHRPMMTKYDWMKSSTYRFNPQTGKTRTKDKYRVVYTDHQRLELEKEFHYSRYITIRRKSELALALGLSERQVKIWFQNRRAKERKMAKKVKMQDLQQQQQTTRHGEDRGSNDRQKDFSHQTQHSHNHHHHHHHHSQHHATLQTSSSPHSTPGAVDTKPKLPIITTMTTGQSDVITKSTSLTLITTTSPPQHVTLQSEDAIASRALTANHVLSSGGEAIGSSLDIPITAADVAHLVLVTDKNPILQS